MSQKPIVLYGHPTANGVPIAAFLEELKAVYPSIDYDVEYIDLSKLTHKEPWFLKLNPNGRIPVVVDRSRNNFAVFETSAILLYLAQHYDKEFKFSFDPAKHPDDYSVLLQWLLFTHGNIDPMQGQAHYFHRRAPKDIPYGKKRYTNETKRLYGVLELRLKDREYLAGSGKGHYTIADIKTWPWVSKHSFAGIESLDGWPSVKVDYSFGIGHSEVILSKEQAWAKRSAERAANVPASEALKKPEAWRFCSM